jgi:transposase
MIAVAAGVRIMVAARPVDFRNGLDGLAALVQQALRENPFAGDLFVFRAKRADRVKILAWDGTGLCLFHKRLEKGRFVWPPVQDGAIRGRSGQNLFLRIRHLRRPAGGAMAFLRSPLAGVLPDVQFLFVARTTAAPYLPPFTRGYADSFACRAVVLRPESRGRLDLVSADPRRPMRIRQNLLSTDKDWATLRAARGWPATSRNRRRRARSSRERKCRGLTRPSIGTSTRISGRPASASTTRSGPARWVPRTTPQRSWM